MPFRAYFLQMLQVQKRYRQGTETVQTLSLGEITGMPARRVKS